MSALARIARPRRERIAAIGCYLLALVIPAAYFAAAYLRGWRP